MCQVLCIWLHEVRISSFADGSVKQGADMGSDGIAISSDGTRLYHCPLAAASSIV